MGQKRLGIYIHIPFCASKCSYCDFYSLAGCDHLMPEYHKALLKHIEESADSISRFEVDTVYFGGGTPSFYGAERIAEVLDAIKQTGRLRVDSEITVECNPDSMTLSSLQLLRQEGVNRLSIGAQATDNDLLKLIGRRHNFQQVQVAVANARKAGFNNVSLDLMYGLPSQTKRDWAETIAKIIELHPEHISCYGLKLEPGTRMYAEYKGSPILPDDDEQADMYCYAAETLSSYGYKQYEISNFSAKGYESRHNLKYWNLEDYMGFGPGAHSGVGSIRYSFVRDVKDYIYGINNGKSIIDEYETVVPLERAVEYIMLGMRTTRGISEKDYKEKTQCSWTPIYKLLLAFKQKGWAEKTGDRWHFTVPGFLISNTLIGIMLEVQATGVIEGVPWVETAEKAEERYDLPKTEDEMFREVYYSGGTGNNESEDAEI